MRTTKTDLPIGRRIDRFLVRWQRPGKKNSFDAKNAKLIKLDSASYSAASNTLTLTPKKAFALTKPVQHRINGQPPSGLQDTSGRLIDGDDNGTPGGNATAILRRGAVTISAVPSSRVQIRSVEGYISADDRASPLLAVERSFGELGTRDHELLSLYEEIACTMASRESARKR